MSSYLGSSDAQKIYPENTVDVLTIKNGVNQYFLSQDVPGAYEANVIVVLNGKVLEPEVDYSIDYSSISGLNNRITFLYSITVTDVIYVIHKGVATYNMAPSPRSVTDDSLSENLRDMVFERFLGVTSQTDFTLVKREWHPRSLIVTIDGQFQVPYINDIDPYDYTLVQNPAEPDDTETILRFTVAPSIGAVITVLHLAFSTVLRRSNYLTELVLTPNIIQTIHINDDAVTEDKMLLSNNEYLRGSKSTSGTENIIRVTSSDEIEIVDTIKIEKNVCLKPTIAADLISGTNLGTSSYRFGTVFTVNLDSSDNISAHDIDADTVTTSDANVNGTLDVTGSLILNGADLSLSGTGVPIGSVSSFYYNQTGGVSLPTLNADLLASGWMIADGSEIPSGSQYNRIRLLCNGNYLPNLCGKFIAGRDATVPHFSSVGVNGGDTFHWHDLGAHTHNITDTNFSIIGGSHSHNVVSSVPVPSHRHCLNRHYHTTVSHSHTIAGHRHLLSFIQPATSTTITLPGTSGTGSNGLAPASSNGSPVHGYNCTLGTYAVNLMSHTDSSLVNGNDAQTTGSSFPETNNILSETSDGHHEWYFTRYNNTSNGDPGFDEADTPQAPTYVSATGVTDYQFTNKTVSGRTETCSSRSGDNGAIAVPYFTLLTIIKVSL